MQLLRCIRGPLKIHEENFVSDKAREEPLTFVSDKACRMKYLKGNIYLRSQVLTVIVQPGYVDSTLDRGEQLSPVKGYQSPGSVLPCGGKKNTPAFTWDRQTIGLGSTPLLSHCCCPMSESISQRRHMI